ncbi:2-phosphosulfolactate phosphatase [Streptomyces sp. NE5-10]|uniref:2-phosphosulfolactate phosphatase n=1 Tax=Streptomyces sp. NE5-10 TaxID=2759674 RepID=UPI0019046550|nr:2-phosphosulfolactate phosphatase [Streptomyces sp. NE5-10]
MDAHFLPLSRIRQVPSVAVVVDVMRAYTVAAWAFARGAEKIVLAESTADALALTERHPGWVALKDGPPAPGFDLVNSPGLLRSADLSGRTVVQKTTAGTVGALAVKHAPLVLCAGFVVAEATARVLRAGGYEEVTFVVTGEDGRADEDLACAEYIAHRAAGPDTTAAPDTTTGPAAETAGAAGITTGPATNTAPAPGATADRAAADRAAPYLRRAAASRAAVELATGIREGAHADDVALCLELDRFPFAMAATLEDGLMVLRPHTPR